MTLRYEFDVDILKMYMYTTTEVSRSIVSKVRAGTRLTDRQTDRHTRTHTDATEGITSQICGRK